MNVLKNLILKGGHWWLSLLLWIILVGPVQAAVELRVAIKKNVSQLQLGSSTTAVIKDASGRNLGQIPQKVSLSAQTRGTTIILNQWQGNQLILEPSNDGYVWIGDRWYRGTVRLIIHDRGILAINYVDLEEYLYSVVGAEAVATWPQEVLKAQAVAARSYAVYKASNATERLYDLDNSTNTQVYKGLNSEHDNTYQAVNATQGQILTYQGQVILAVFHSSSGGHTENVEDVWTSPLPYLRGVVDYDHHSPVYQWSVSFSNQQLGQLIPDVGVVQALIPEKTTPQGRVVAMKVVGDRATQIIKGSDLRKMLNLRSTLFVVSSTNNGHFHFSGRGFGHGVGLSQWGAYQLAKQGVPYLEILFHYYPSTTLLQLE